MQREALRKLSLGMVSLGVAVAVTRDLQHTYSDSQREKLVFRAINYINSAEKLMYSRNVGEVALNALVALRNLLEYRAASGRDFVFCARLR
jgi:hypothetical protein